MFLDRRAALDEVESVWVSDHFGRPLVKAFNNLVAHTLAHAGNSAGEKDRIAMAISGNNKNDKKVISDLVDEVGFDAVDAGNLSESWRHQPGTPPYCTELQSSELKEAPDLANRAKAGELRDRVIEKFQDFKSAPSRDEVVRLNRWVYSRKT